MERPDEGNAPAKPAADEARTRGARRGGADANGGASLLPGSGLGVGLGFLFATEVGTAVVNEPPAAKEANADDDGLQQKRDRDRDRDLKLDYDAVGKTAAKGAKEGADGARRVTICPSSSDESRERFRERRRAKKAAEGGNRRNGPPDPGTTPPSNLPSPCKDRAGALRVGAKVGGSGPPVNKAKANGGAAALSSDARVRFLERRMARERSASSSTAAAGREGDEKAPSSADESKEEIEEARSDGNKANIPNDGEEEIINNDGDWRESSATLEDRALGIEFDQDAQVGIVLPGAVAVTPTVSSGAAAGARQGAYREGGSRDAATIASHPHGDGSTVIAVPTAEVVMDDTDMEREMERLAHEVRRLKEDQAGRRPTDDEPPIVPSSAVVARRVDGKRSSFWRKLRVCASDSRVAVAAIVVGAALVAIVLPLAVTGKLNSGSGNGSNSVQQTPLPTPNLAKPPSVPLPTSQPAALAPPTYLTNDDDGISVEGTPRPTPAPIPPQLELLRTLVPTSEPAAAVAPPTPSLKEEICSDLPSTCPDLSREGAPQREALTWMTMTASSSSLDADSDELPLPPRWRRIQRYVLVVLAFSLEGWVTRGVPHWTNGTDECEWALAPDQDPWREKIQCDASGRVVGIRFDMSDAGLRPNLNGWNSVPRDVALLADSLEDLSLRAVDLMGTIPTELGMLTKLTNLDLDNNRLDDRIPTELGRLARLGILRLDGNKLSGAVPTELGLLFRLGELFLYGNYLTGTIPEEVCGLHERRGVGDLYHLEGDCFGAQWQCNCCSNCPTPLPTAQPTVSPRPTSSNASSLRQKICFDLPTACEDLLREGAPQREALAWMASDVHLDELPEWRRVQRYVLVVLAFSLEGWVTRGVPHLEGHPEECEWALAPDQDSWRTAIQCDASGRVVRIRFDMTDAFLESGLVGENGVPRDVALLAESLEDLSLRSVDFAGTVPTELAMLTKLMALTLDDNQLSGRIPTELGNLTRLEELSFAENRLSGPIPTELGHLTRLRELFLHGNYLTGTMPEEVCRLKQSNSKMSNIEADCSQVKCNCCNNC